MTTFEKIKYYYDKGLYKQAHLDTFLKKNVITQEQYNTILGIVEETETETEA